MLGLKDIIGFKFNDQDESFNLPDIAIFQTHLTNIPVFQYSIRGEAPNMMR
jgi:hypothetical protein